MLKGHSKLWDRADLDTTFPSLKSVYLNSKSNLRVGYIKKSTSIVPGVSFDPRSLLEISFWANFYSSYYIILSYLVKNSNQRVMNKGGEKRVGGRAGEISFVYQNNKRNQSVTLASK